MAGELETPEALEAGNHKFTGIMIAIPCGSGAIRHETVVSLLQTMQIMTVNKIFGEVRIAPQDSLVMRARNTLVAWFMNSKCSHLLFVDDDLAWDAKDVLRMVKVDKDYVCGAYRRKVDDESYTVVFPDDAAKHLTICPHCSCVEIEAGNVGFAMLHRDLFEKMFAAYPDLKIGNPPDRHDERTIAQFYDLFDTSIRDGQFIGEDYTFSALWRRIGGRIWLDPSISLTHFGTKGFVGNIARWFLDAARPTVKVSDKWKEIQGWLGDRQAEILQREVAALPAGGTVVEFGSWRGRSTALLGMAAAAADRDIRVYAVDHFKGTENERQTAHQDAAYDEDGVYPEFLANLAGLGLLGNVVIPIRDEFSAAVQRLPDLGVDLLFLDGDHAALATARAFKEAEGKVKPGGTVVFHDYNWSTVNEDVKSLGIEVEQVYDMAIWRKPKEA